MWLARPVFAAPIRASRAQVLRMRQAHEVEARLAVGVFSVDRLPVAAVWSRVFSSSVMTSHSAWRGAGQRIAHAAHLAVGSGVWSRKTAEIVIGPGQWIDQEFGSLRMLADDVEELFRALLPPCGRCTRGPLVYILATGTRTASTMNTSARDRPAGSNQAEQHPSRAAGRWPARQRPDAVSPSRRRRAKREAPRDQSLVATVGCHRPGEPTAARAGSPSECDRGAHRGG
jgi:hypothetical protein